MISDVHGNLPALEAVLADISAAGLDQIWCLGDVVGYGAQPQECADIVAERADLCLVGNHDLAVIGALDIAAFSPAAAAAVRWTQENVNDSCARVPARTETVEHRPRSRPLPRVASRSGLGVRALARSGRRVHRCAGAPRLFRRPFARGALLRHRGRNHPRRQRGRAKPESRGAQVGAGTTLDITAGRWLLNPGSVGQPRDADPRAAWLELDTELWTASYRRVDYEIERAAAAIMAAGLPEQLARRLHVGQ